MPEPAGDDEPGLLASTVTTLRLIVGWALIALGVLNLAMGLATVAYTVFHVVLLFTGLLLLGLGRVGRRPGRITLLAGGLVAVLGLVISAIPALTVECCARGYAVRHGYPFTMLARDPGSWHLDAGQAVADLLFWACAGTIVAVVVAHLVPAAPAEPTRPATAPRHNAHAEGRVAREQDRPREARAADDENVGGLP